MKQPDWKVPLILSTTLVVFGTFAYWLQYSHKPKKEQLETQEKKPLALPSPAPQIAAIKIKSSKGLIEIKCDELAQKNCKPGAISAWTISYPGTLKADSENVKVIVNAASNLIAAETIDLTDETPEKRKHLLEEYGLSDAKRTDLAAQFIEFDLEGGKRLTAWFGTEHPVGDKTFVATAEDGQLRDKTIFLIANSFKNNFDLTVSHFRDKTLFTFDRGAIESFEAKTPGGQISAKLDNGLWTVNGLSGDTENISTLFSSVASMKAKDFPQADVIKGLSPMFNYKLTGKQGSYTIALYQKTTKYPKPKNKLEKQRPDETHQYVKVSGKDEVFEVDSSVFRSLDKKAKDFRQRTILAQVEKVTGTHAKLESKVFTPALELSLDAGKWVQKSGAAVNVESLQKLIDQLVLVKVQDFAPLAAQPDPLTISLGDDKNPSKFHMKFYLVKDRLYAQDLNSKQKEALVLPDALKNALPFKLDAWKKSETAPKNAAAPKAEQKK